MKGLIHGFRHYAVFSGRDSRSLFWGFIIWSHLIGILFILPMAWLVGEFFRAFVANLGSIDVSNEQNSELVVEIFKSTLTETFGQSPMLYPVAATCALIATLWSLICIIPSIATTVRRLRDAGQSPWWIIAPCTAWVPMVGYISSLLSFVVLVFCFFPSKSDVPGVPGDDSLPDVPKS